MNINITTRTTQQTNHKIEIKISLKTSEKVNCYLAVVNYGPVKFAATSQCMLVLFKRNQSFMFCGGHFELLDWSNPLQKLL